MGGDNLILLPCPTPASSTLGGLATFICSQIPLITASCTCFMASPSCSTVMNWGTTGWPTEFSPDVCKGEASDPPGGFSTTLCFPLSRRLEALDLVSTILLDDPHRRRQIVSERNNVNEEKQDGLTWMVRSGDDVARDGLETPNTCTKDCPGCVFRGRPLRRSSQNQEKEMVRKLRKSGLSYREVLKGDNVGDSRNYPPQFSPPLFFPFNEVGLAYLYP